MFERIFGTWACLLPGWIEQRAPGQIYNWSPTLPTLANAQNAKVALGCNFSSNWLAFTIHLIIPKQIISNIFCRKISHLVHPLTPRKSAGIESQVPKLFYIFHTDLTNHDFFHFPFYFSDASWPPTVIKYTKKWFIRTSSSHWGCLSHKIVGRVGSLLRVCLWLRGNWVLPTENKDNLPSRGDAYSIKFTLPPLDTLMTGLPQARNFEN